MKRLIAAVAALVVASSAHAQSSPKSTYTGGTLKLRNCYTVKQMKESGPNTYVMPLPDWSPRHGATLNVRCNDERDMMVSHGAATPDIYDSPEVNGSYGEILAMYPILMQDGIPRGVHVDTTVGVLGKPYRLSVWGLCCRFK